MAQYLLSVHMAADASPPSSMTDEQVSDLMNAIAELESEMRSSGALVFSGRLTGADRASVVDAQNGSVLTTDGPYVEAKESIGGFYIIKAEDLDSARAWAAKTSAVIRTPIEVRPFVDSRQG